MALGAIAYPGRNVRGLYRHCPASRVGYEAVDDACTDLLFDEDATSISQPALPGKAGILMIAHKCPAPIPGAKDCTAEAQRTPSLDSFWAFAVPTDFQPAASRR